MTIRTKTVGSTSPVVGQWTQTFSDSTPDATWNNSGESISYYHHEGFNTPRFHSRRRKGELLPMTKWTQEYIQGTAEGSYEITKNGVTISSIGNRQFMPDVFPSVGVLSSVATDNNFVDQAQRMTDAAAASIYKQNWDTLTFLAELHKTVRMFRNFLRNLGKLASDPNQVYNAWLEGRYGWRILMYDLIDIQKALSNLDRSRERFNQANGYSLEYSDEVTMQKIFGSADLLATVVDTWACSIRGHVVADIKPPEFIFNPILTGWELIPYSFVIDWIINVGGWIEQLSFHTLQTNYTASMGWHINYTRKFKSLDANWKDGWSGSYTMDCDIEGFLTVRVPTTVSYLPSISLNLDAFKVLDLVALVMQAIRR